MSLTCIFLTYTTAFLIPLFLTTFFFTYATVFLTDYAFLTHASLPHTWSSSHVIQDQE